jgi:hypothetical protein
MRVQRFMQACALAVLMAPAVVRASGYAIYEQGAAALGMAGAYVASAHDATAQFYNPAAMTRLEGKQLSVGGTWLSKQTSFSGVAPYPGFGVTEKMKTGNFFPPNVYFTSHLNEKWGVGRGHQCPVRSRRGVGGPVHVHRPHDRHQGRPPRVQRLGQPGVRAQREVERRRRAQRDVCERRVEQYPDGPDHGRSAGERGAREAQVRLQARIWLPPRRARDAERAVADRGDVPERGEGEDRRR